MPGAGKSTVGIILAKALAKDFVDTDLLIQRAEGLPLQKILEERGVQGLRAAEEKVLVALNTTDSVIATGGSAVYSKAGMRQLQTDAHTIYLRAQLPELRRRIHNFDTRGIAKEPEQSFDELYRDRSVLYDHYADSIVNVDERTQDQVVAQITTLLDALQ